MLNTVNIVNIHDQHENKVEIKYEIESAVDLDDEINNLGLKNFSIDYRSEKILFTQP